MIQAVALGCALMEADQEVREVGGNNRGPRVRQYLDGADIHVDAPWCAAFVQYCSDVAADGIGVTNPLDDVKLEALVQSYYDMLEGSVVPLDVVEPGDLALFRFGGSARWNHIGFVAEAPKDGTFMSVEGNTGDVSQRDGDGVYLKPRTVTDYPVCFIRWDGRVFE